MTNDMPTTVANIKRILQDRPDEDFITADFADTDTVLGAADITKWQKGQVWEFSDGDIVLVYSVDTTTNLVTVKRSHEDSTATAHSSGSIVQHSPRFRYNLIAQAVNTVLDNDLDTNNVYDIQEHQILSSASQIAYNAPTADCVEFLAVYQVISPNIIPAYLHGFTPLGTNVDSSIFSNGTYFIINENLGTAGTDIYYVNCRHPLTITTVSSIQERILHNLGAAYLLEWSEPKRAAGPTNQSAQSVPPGTALRDAAYFRQIGQTMLTQEVARLRRLNPPQRNFRRA